MIRVVVGHRGVGKTSFLERVTAYYLAADKAVWTMSLDEIIEEEEGRSIHELFAELGENGFRHLERKYFQQSLRHAQALQRTRSAASKLDIWIAVGAGFQGPLPPDLWVIYLRRDSDRRGRIFLNRPRLEPHLSPMEEFAQRREQREDRFKKWANEEVFLPEGYNQAYSAERSFVLNQIERVGGYITILPEDVERLKRHSGWWQKRKTWGVHAWELRDDLLTPEQIQFMMDTLGPQNILLSFRSPELVESTYALMRPEVHCDWASELGACSLATPDILSFHQRPANLRLSDFLLQIGRLADDGVKLKVAVPIYNFRELLEGHRWAIQNPQQRSFLPVSADGRWQWYRLLTRGLFAIQFLREGEGSSADQPTLLQWLNCPPSAWEFAAVVGDPVGHSYSPAEHGEFFAKQGLPFLAVPINAQDWEQGALAVLWDMGLRFAAVTAPLKLGAYSRAGRVDRLAAKFGTVNTLMWDASEQLWRGGNTDFFGLEVLLAEVRLIENLVVWGAGGTLPLLKELLPQAQFYSARRGQPREGSIELRSPEVVIWGAGRAPNLSVPPASWRPRLVIDLNYAEDSPGREWAAQVMAKYKSGHSMFAEQAKAQRKFWGLCGCEQ